MREEQVTPRWFRQLGRPTSPPRLKRHGEIDETGAVGGVGYSMVKSRSISNV